MARSGMILILAVGRNIKCLMKVTLCLMTLNKIVEIKYTYVFLNQPMEQNILWRVTILFIFQRMGGRRGLLREKVRWPEGKNILQRKLGNLFLWGV